MQAVHFFHIFHLACSFFFNTIRIVENVREVYMPVIWFDVSADLSDHLLGLIHFTLIGPYIGSFCFFLLFVGSMVVVAKSGVKYAKMKKERPKTEATAEQEISAVSYTHLTLPTTPYV